MPEAGVDRVDMSTFGPSHSGAATSSAHSLVLRHFDSLVVAHHLLFPFFAIAWRMQKMRAAEARRVGSDHGLMMEFTGSMGMFSLFL